MPSSWCSRLAGWLPQHSATDGAARLMTALSNMHGCAPASESHDSQAPHHDQAPRTHTSRRPHLQAVPGAERRVQVHPGAHNSTHACKHAHKHARTHACEYTGSTPRESGCDDAITLRTPVTWRVRWLAGRRVGLIVCCWLLRTHLRSNCARRRSTLLSSARCTGPSSRPARSPISPPTVPRRRSCVSACTNSVSAYVRQSVLCTTAWCFCSWLCSVPVDASSVGGWRVAGGVGEIMPVVARGSALSLSWNGSIQRTNMFLNQLPRAAQDLRQHPDAVSRGVNVD